MVQGHSIVPSRVPFYWQFFIIPESSLFKAYCKIFEKFLGFFVLQHYCQSICIYGISTRSFLSHFNVQVLAILGDAICAGLIPFVISPFYLYFTTWCKGFGMLGESFVAIFVKKRKFITRSIWTLVRVRHKNYKMLKCEQWLTC